MEDNTFKERKEQILSLLDDLEPNEWEVVKAEGTRRVRHKVTTSDTYTPKEYFSYDMGLLAYRYILDNGGTAEEALIYAIEIFNKPEEWLADTKNRKYFYSKQVVEKNDDHPQQKLMTDNGTMDRSALKQSHSVNQLIRKLSKSKILSDQLENLKKADTEQQEKILHLEANTITMDTSIDTLYEKLSIEPLSKKDKALLLIKAGHTYKTIASVLGVSERSIKRWVSLRGE